MKEFKIKISDLKKLSCRNFNLKDRRYGIIRSFDIMDIILSAFFKLRGDLYRCEYDINNNYLFMDTKLLNIYNKLKEEKISKLIINKKYNSDGSVYLLIQLNLEED